MNYLPFISIILLPFGMGSFMLGLLIDYPKKELLESEFMVVGIGMVMISLFTMMVFLAIKALP